MIDTHTHIYLPEFEDGGEGAYLRAVDAGVEMMVLPNVDLTSAEPLLALHSRHPDRLRTAFGLHPTSVDASWRDTLDAIVPLLESEGCVAVGEVGMDLYWDSTFRSGQMEAFACQLDMAASRSLPVIIHCREALDETLEVIAAGGFGRMPLLFHSFTGRAADAVRIIEAVPGARFGINGVVTFKNARDLHAAVPEIGLDRIVLETDSPYLAPVPHRGKRNESAYITAVRDKVAELTGTTPAEAEAATDRNARMLFNI